MDRDGFTLLAMGFTGASALAWKLRYIGAFNYRRRPHRFRRMFSV
jgi:phage regulator Rha-like protein